MRSETVHTYDELFSAVVRALERSASGVTRTLVVDAAAADAWRRRLAADRPDLAFGLSVTTLPGLVEERWPLLGDGRRIVTSSERPVLVAAALQQARADGRTRLPLTSGTVSALQEAVREGMCHEGFARRLVDLSSTSSSSRRAPSATVVLQGYLDALRERGLLEYGEALFLLARGTRALPGPVVRVGSRRLLPAEEALLDSLDAAAFRLEPLPDGDGDLAALVRHLYRPGEPLAPTGAVRFACASGPAAEPPLLARVVADACAVCHDPGAVFVSCADPVAVFEQVAPRLADAGVASTVRYRVPFSQTVLGRAFLALKRALSDADATRSERVAGLTDFATSVFSDVPRERAWSVDALMRRDASRSVAEQERLLASSDPRLRALFDHVRAGRFAEAVSLLARRDVSEQVGDWEAELSRRGAERAVSVFASCRSCGLGREAVDLFVEALSVSCRCRVGESSIPAVRFGTLADLAHAECAVAVLAQLSASAYSLSTRTGALDELFDVLGVARADTRLADLRLQLSQALSRPSRAVVLERCLTDASGAPQRPSVLFEEVVDCFRADPADDADLDGVRGVPAAFVEREVEGLPLVYEQGEEELVSLFPRAFGSEPGREDTRPVEETLVQTAFRLPASEALRLARGRGADEPVFSASEVEAYLACPLSWFLARKVDTVSFEDDRSALVRGTFAHLVLMRFYARLHATGAERVTAEGLPRAREVFSRVFDECVSENEALLELDSAVARHAVEQLRGRLGALVEDDATLLPGFAPRYLEQPFGEGRPFVYAGHAFRGRIDRVDVDEAGQAVVLDYKGSLGRAFEPAEDEAGLLRRFDRIQVLVYAQAVRRELGLDVAAAVYRSYSRPEMRGAFDPRRVSDAAFPGYRLVEVVARDSFDFGSMLDACEEQVAATLERMLAGDVAPDPAHPGVCVTCPALDCPRRMR